MSQLSPAAKAVLEACGTPDVDSPFRLVARGFAAAALRAAADQVAPPGDCPTRTADGDMRQFQDQWSRWHQASLAQHHLLAIAAELEAQ